MKTARSVRWKAAWRSVPLLPVLAFAGWLLWPAVQSESVESRDPAGGVETAVVSSAGPEAVARVEAGTVVRRDLPLVAEATGRLQPWRRTTVSAASGGRVVWRGVEEGQRVAAGESLLRLDDHLRRIELAEAEAELLKVRAAFAVSFSLQRERWSVDDSRDPRVAVVEGEEEFREKQALHAQGLIGEQELSRARRLRDALHLLAGDQQDDVRAATIGLTQAEQRLERARLELAGTTLQAPFAGRVADLKVEVGQQVAAGVDCLVLVDESRMTVDVDVLEGDVVWLRRRAPARVRVPSLDGRVFAGAIQSINPLVDPQTGTGRVTVAIANPDGALMSGLFAFVELEARRLEDRLVVPAAAVLSRQQRELVFRLEGGRAHWTDVRVGARSGDLVEIVSGLAEGDLVAIGGHFALAHEAPAEIVRDSQAPAVPEPAPGRGGRS